MRRAAAPLAFVLASAALVAATFLPYRWLEAHAPQGMAFSGLSTHVPDGSSYLMWMGQHRDGALQVVNRMTTDPHDPFPGNPTWLALGLLARAGGLDLAAAYHAGRALLAFLYLLALAWAFRRLLPGRGAAALAWVLAATGGGLSWLSSLGLPLPSADAWMPELWSFPSLLHFPHFALSLLLVALCLGALAPALGTARRGPGVVAGLALALLVHVHPYTAATLAAGLAVAWALGRWQARRGAAGEDVRAGDPAARAVGLLDGPLPPALALGALSFALAAAGVAASPMLQSWAARNVMPSPPPGELLAGLGVPALAALAGLWRVHRAKAWTPALALLAAWGATALAMAYAGPLIPFERRCLEGVHLALAAFAALAVLGPRGPSAPAAAPAARRSRAPAAALAAILVLASLPATPAAALRECTAGNPGFVDDDWPDLARAARDLAGDQGILAPPRHALYLAAFAGARVFAAHHELTPEFGRRLRQVEAFFTRPLDAEARQRMLQEARCPFVAVDRDTAQALLGPGLPGLLEPRASGRTWVLYGPPAP